jgi:hypothetical protein
MRIEQVSPFRRQSQAALAVAKVNQLDVALIVEVLRGVVRKIKLVFRHDAERADGCQRTAVFAVELIDSIALNDQFALVTARQVEVVHQPVARIVVVPVALVIHARPFVNAIPRTAFARITSSIGHHSVRCCCNLGLSGRRPGRFCEGVVQGRAVAPGRNAAAFRAWSPCEPGL